jgi:hypothetical protein
LVFIQNEKSRGVSAEDALTLGFQSRHKNWSVQIFCKITRGDANIPSEGFPFTPLVISQSAGWNRVNSLAKPGGFRRLQKQLKDTRLTRTGWGINDDIRSALQVTHCILLPEIREVQGG